MPDGFHFQNYFCRTLEVCGTLPGILDLVCPELGQERGKWPGAGRNGGITP